MYVQILFIFWDGESGISPGRLVGCLGNNLEGNLNWGILCAICKKLFVMTSMLLL